MIVLPNKDKQFFELNDNKTINSPATACDICISNGYHPATHLSPAISFSRSIVFHDAEFPSLKMKESYSYMYLSFIRVGQIFISNRKDVILQKNHFIAFIMELFGNTKDAIRANYFFLRERLSPSVFTDAHQIPIIINNFNRLSMLKKLIQSLTSRGYSNIVILDNKSTYPPLMEWYATCPFEVIHLPKNFGFKALWHYTPARRRFCADYYIYTDADVMLSPECPADVIERMFHILKHERRKAFKIGPSIRISDLPDHYAHKQQVLEFESKYFKEKSVVNGLLLYRAPIDTTFALYRPRIGLSRRVSLEAYRMAEPYSILHLPWYENSSHLCEESNFYMQACQQPTMWSKKK